MGKTLPALTIRFARLEEAEELQSMIHGSYRGIGGWTTEAHIVVGERLTLEETKALLADPNTWENEPVLVAELAEPDEDGKRLVGCIQPSKGIHGARSAHATGERMSTSKVPHTETTTTPNGSHETLVKVVPAIPEVIQPNPTPVTTAMFSLFAVPPAYQSKGIGSRLIQAALSHMRDEWKCDKCIVWVLENRPELLVWYRKMGFVWNGEMRPFPFPEYMQTKADFRILEMNL